MNAFVTATLERAAPRPEQSENANVRRLNTLARVAVRLPLQTLTYRRNPNPYPDFSRVTCMENTRQTVIGQENYFLSADGTLMPAKKDQAPPDLRYFKPTPPAKQ
jgi:hypothetical protein